MSATTPTANDLLELLFRSGGSFDIGLSSTLPDDTGAGWTEPVDTAYARPSINCDTTDWAAPAARQIDTAVDIVWPDPATDADWTDLLFWLMFAPGTDDLRFYSRLSSRFTVPVGSTARLVAGEIWYRVPASTLTL